jgi:hypothetical protein
MVNDMDTTPLAALDQLIDDASPSEKAALVVALSARLAVLGATLSAPADAETLLEPEEAASIAKVPVRRVWSWSRAADAQEWAVHLGPKTLRIRESAWRAYWEKKCLRWSESHGASAKVRRRARNRPHDAA